MAICTSLSMFCRRESASLTAEECRASWRSALDSSLHGLESRCLSLYRLILVKNVHRRVDAGRG